MTPLAAFFAIGTVTLALTAMWAILARETAVYLTSGLSFVGYAWMSLVAPDVALVAQLAEPMYLRSTLAPVQLIALAMAVVSLIVFTLRLFDAYPSPSDTDDAQTDNRQAT